MNNNIPAARYLSLKKPQTWLLLLVIIVAGGAGYWYFGGSKSADTAAGSGGKAGRNGGKPMPVMTATASTDEIAIFLNGLGTVTPLATVSVKSRIDGEIMQLHFKEGQMVKRGQLLAEIDPRPYQAALMQAEGQWTRDKALLANARIDLERYRALLKQDSIAAQQVDTQQALVQQYEGTVKIDEGLLATAKLNLQYAHITAPVAGVIGLRQVDLGNIVHSADSTGIAVITQLQPMSVLFSLPEDNIPALLNNLRAGKKIAVDAYDRAFQIKLTSGMLLTVDNQIDSTTGMVKLRAQFANQDLSLFPNQFVNAKLLLDIKHGVITIPSAAIQRGNGFNFVYVVAQNQTVSERKVTVGISQGEKSEIIKGLQSGEVVVTDGLDKLRDGAKVLLPGDAKTAAEPAQEKHQHKHASSAAATEKS